MAEERTVRWGKGGYGFIANYALHMIRCGECDRENYGPAVASGQCAWCADAPDPEMLLWRDASRQPPAEP